MSHSYTIGTKVYPLTDEQYNEVLAKDTSTEHSVTGDTEFTEWLTDYVKKNKIKPEKIQRADQGSGYWYKGWGHGHSDEQLKLARILQSMNGLISVMNPAAKPRATYDEGASTSYWRGIEDNNITLPVFPVGRLDEQSAVNVMGGFSTHEVHHSTETIKIMRNNLQLQNIMDKKGWESAILNVLEDNRIDAISAKKFPGTKFMMDSTMDFLSPPDELFDIDPDWFNHGSNERFQAMLMAVRYPDKWDQTTQSHPEYAKFGEDIRKIYNSYDPLDANENPNNKNIIGTIDQIKQFLALDDSERPSQQTIKYQVCGSAHGDSFSDQQDGKNANALVEENVQVIDDEEIRTRYLLPEGQMGPSRIVITKPKDKGRKVLMNSSLLAKAKAALLFRRAIPQNDTRLQRHGELDEDELYRFAMNDYRIFKDAEVAHLPKTFVGMLIDISGSMAGQKTKWAMQMAHLLLIAAKSKNNVHARVYAHTSDDGAAFYRIWEEGDNPDRLSLIDGHLPSGANYDSYAVAWAGDEVAAQDAEQKLLLVISDGLPAEISYGGIPAQNHVRYHVDRLERKGVDVIQIAIGSELEPEDQSRMYKRWIPFLVHGDANSAFAKTLKELTKMLEKL